MFYKALVLRHPSLITAVNAGVRTMYGLLMCGETSTDAGRICRSFWDFGSKRPFLTWDNIDGNVKMDIRETNLQDMWTELCDEGCYRGESFRVHNKREFLDWPFSRKNLYCSLDANWIKLVVSELHCGTRLCSCITVCVNYTQLTNDINTPNFVCLY
jgi:hypothetical protein